LLIRPKKNRAWSRRHLCDLQDIAASATLGNTLTAAKE
jgi:hypothetical protein